MTLLTGNGVKFAHLAAQVGACKLQLKWQKEGLPGTGHSSGKSIIAICKREYKLRGTNEFVVEQLEAMVAGAIASREYQRGINHDLQRMANAYKYGELQNAFIRGVEEY